MIDPSARGLALFDLDHTLIPLDSDHGFGEWMCELGWTDADGFRQANDQFYADYKAACLDLSAYVRFSTAPWRARSREEQAWAGITTREEVLRAAVSTLQLVGE